MIKKITFLLQHKKNASSHLFIKQLKTSNRTNRLEVSFLHLQQPGSKNTTGCNYSYIIGSAKPPD